MPEIKLTREEIFGGRLIAPMRQWLKKQGRDTQNYPYNDDMAIITHYLQNKNIEAYREQAICKMKDYYRALHSLDAEAPVSDDEAEAIFEDWNQAKLCQMYKDNHSFTFVDLFAGIGGFRIALEQLGGKCVYASEFNTIAQKSYGMNHGVIPFGDITKEKNKALVPEHVDVLCAGFPCQPFSMAGLRRGFTDQTKGTLFFDLAKIIRDKRPHIILLENVPGLMSIHDRDESGNKTDRKTITTILDILRNELHYNVPEPEILNACHFGVPQNRDRVFIVGFRDEDASNYQYPHSNGKVKYFKEIRETGEVDSRYFMSARYWKTLVDHREAQRAKGRGYGYCKVKDDEFGHTLMVGGMGLERNLVEDTNHIDFSDVNDRRGELNQAHIRVLTERECKLMQGFPNEFDEKCVGRSSVYDQFGNSVAVPVVNEVARTLLEYADIRRENHI